MPFINIKVANNKLAQEDKEELIKRITEVSSEVLKKDPEMTFIVIEEVGTDNWGVGGVSVTNRIKNGATL